MIGSTTPGAARALARAGRRALARGGTAIEAFDLLAALADESESRAAEMLIELGLAPDRLWSLLGTSGPFADDGERPSAESESGLDAAGSSAPPPLSDELRVALGFAAHTARVVDRNRSVGTEHLLAGILNTSNPVVETLAAEGFAPGRLTIEFEQTEREETAPIPLAAEIEPLRLTEPGLGDDLARIFDASSNRAGEGLRVVEDYVRFALDDPGLTRRVRETRRRLGETIRALDVDARLAARDTPGDVGAYVMTAAESPRESLRDVLVANFRRCGEALRSLEEYAKLIDVWIAGRFEVLRYDVYTLEKMVMTAVNARSALGDARLQVLVGGLPTLGDLTWVVGEALAGGADVIQLREKNLPEREWLRRAREVRILTAQSKSRFLVNDRPDLARLAGADGVHLGQDDLRVRDARRVVGPRAVIGVSTHDRAQIDQAVVDGAGCLGVGPVFASGTKAFEELAGPALVSAAAEMTNLPWFAIGGITLDNLDEVLEAGARRVAVSAAIVRAERPRVAARAFRDRLDAVD